MKFVHLILSQRLKALYNDGDVKKTRYVVYFAPWNILCHTPIQRAHWGL